MELTCKQCGTTFIHKQRRPYCSHPCSAKARVGIDLRSEETKRRCAEGARKYRKGKTWEEIYGAEQAQELRQLYHAKTGECAANWRGGISRRYGRKQVMSEFKTFQCSSCGSKERLFVHHINENPEDNRLENLRILCHSCHNKLHHTGNKYKRLYQRGPKVT